MMYWLLLMLSIKKLTTGHASGCDGPSNGKWGATGRCPGAVPESGGKNVREMVGI